MSLSSPCFLTNRAFLILFRRTFSHGEADLLEQER